MTKLVVALLQIAAFGYDQAANLAAGEAACREAASRGADIALFPELWNIGYAFESADAATPFNEAQGRAREPSPDQAAALVRWRAQAIAREDGFAERFRGLARELHMAIALTYLERWPDGPRNAVSLFDRHGRRVLDYAKVHTCGFGWPEADLTPGDEFPVCWLDTAVGEVSVGAMICFDREFPESARLLALAGAELILVPNACEMEANRLGQVRARAFENMVAVALANYPAPQQNGHSVAFSPIAFSARGASLDTLIVEAGESEGISLAPIDLDALRDWRRREVWGSAWRRPQTYGPLVAPQST